MMKSDREQLRKKIVLLIIIVLLACSNACTRSTNASETQKIESGANFILDPFIMNLANHGDAGAVKVSIALELANTALVEKAKTRTAQLRDAVIMLLSTRSKEDLASPEGKMQLKDEILLQANQILKEGSVKNIYFSDFVMQ